MLDFATALLNSLKDVNGVIAVVIVALVMSIGILFRRVLTREDRLQSQLDGLHQEIKDSIVPLTVQCKDALNGCQQAISHNSEVILRLINGRDK